MPMSRLAAGTGEMSLPSTVTVPLSAISNPARIRSAVVLPQPDGPSSATSSPGAISSDRPFSARTAPNDLLTSRRLTGAPPLAARPGTPAAVAEVMLVASTVPPALPAGVPPGDGSQVDLGAAGTARPPAADRADQQQEEPGHEQRQQRRGGRDRAAGLVEGHDPDRERLVQVEAGHGELAEHERDGEHRGRQQGRAQVRQDHSPQRG